MIKRTLKKIKEYEEIGVLIFPIVVLFIAPYVYEYVHILFLEIFKCPYNSFITLSLEGVYGYVEPLCYLSPEQTFIVLISPVIINLCIGIALFGISFHLKPRKHPIVFIIISSIAMGFVTSSSLNLFSENYNDVYTAFKSAEIYIPKYYLTVAGILILLISTIAYLELLFEISKVVQIRKPKAKHR